MRSKLDVQWRALALTLDLLALGRASVGIWRAAVSLWVHVLLFRRCGLSLLHDVFAFGGDDAHSGGELDSRRVIPLRGRAASELLSLVVLSPFFETDLRAKWASRAIAIHKPYFGAPSPMRSVAAVLPSALTEIKKFFRRKFC